MAKRTRAPARGGRTTQTTQHSRKPAKKTANKTAEKPKRKTGQKSEFAQTRQASLMRRRIYTPEFLTYVRQRFEQSEDLLVDIGQDVRISRESVRHLASASAMETLCAAAARTAACSETCGAGRDTRPSSMEPSTHKYDGVARLPQAEGEGDIPPLAGTVVRLHRAVLDELAAIETMPRSLAQCSQFRAYRADAREPHRNLAEAATHATNPRHNGPDDDDMPADIDEFRNALARRIEASRKPD